MHAHRTQFAAFLAASALMAALWAPAATAAGSSDGPSNALLRNDNAHFGPTSVLQAPTPPLAAPVVVVRVDGGFDWVSGGVGAAGGLAAVLAVGVATAALGVRTNGNKARA